MNGSNRGFMLPLLLAIVSILIVGGTFYAYERAHNSAYNGAVYNTQVSVSGMRKYSDDFFGFSFWYPDGWRVNVVSPEKPNNYSGGIVARQLDVVNGERKITIEEVTATSSIQDATGVGACPVCVPLRYYFDKNTHMWMVEYPDGSDIGLAPGTIKAADVSQNTMGGLHMLAGSHRFGGNVIIPLSAENFVVVTVDGAIATGTSDPKALAKTVAALDPKAAAPAGVLGQEAVVEAERAVYADLPGTINFK